MTTKPKYASPLVLSILISLLGVAVNARAQGQDSPGSADHPLVTRYAGSFIDGYEVRDFDEYTLPLGPAVKDAAGRRVPSKKETLARISILTLVRRQYTPTLPEYHVFPR